MLYSICYTLYCTNKYPALDNERVVICSISKQLAQSQSTGLSNGTLSLVSRHKSQGHPQLAVPFAPNASALYYSLRDDRFCYLEDFDSSLYGRNQCIGGH